MPVFPDSTQEELNSTYGLDKLFVTSAFRMQVMGVSVEDVDLLRWDVDYCIRKILLRN